MIVPGLGRHVTRPRGGERLPRRPAETDGSRRGAEHRRGAHHAIVPAPKRVPGSLRASFRGGPITSVGVHTAVWRHVTFAGMSAFVLANWMHDTERD